MLPPFVVIVWAEGVTVNVGAAAVQVGATSFNDATTIDTLPLELKVTVLFSLPANVEFLWPTDTLIPLPVCSSNSVYPEGGV